MGYNEPTVRRSLLPLNSRMSTRHILCCMKLTAALLIASAPQRTFASEKLQLFLANHCIDCHGLEEPESGFDLSNIDWQLPDSSAEKIEQALRKIRGHQMPPEAYGALDEKLHSEVVAELESLLDERAVANPYVGPNPGLRRLTRTEYQNAIRHLLGVNINAKQLLPKDEESHGFDNTLVNDLTPTRMDRYIAAAEKIARLAVGKTGRGVDGKTIRIRPDITQEDRMPGLPIGTRGGTKFRFDFPRGGMYEFQLRLARDRNEHVEGMNRKHEIQILIDRDLKKSFTVDRPRDQDHSEVDKHLQARIGLQAGTHEVVVTFVKDSDSLMETMRQPLESKFNFHRHPRQTPALYEVTVLGPFGERPISDVVVPAYSPLYSYWPTTPNAEARAAQTILSHLTRHAFRRAVDEEDLERPLAFYKQTRENGGDFRSGIESAIASILVSPKFLLRVESKATGKRQGAQKRELEPLTDYELASRLSFFLWSSVPDEFLLDTVEQNQLRNPDVLRGQVEYMLADSRADSLVTNFAAQWLYLRNLESFTPEARLFPDFDDNLRQAFRQETEHHFREIMRENRSVLGLIQSDHTYLNERLAKHYGIPHVYGSHFRRVDLPEGSKRGGLLRQASILSVTSYSHRTSPVLRGNWILENLLGNPAPPPPADVPTLEENTVAAGLPIRERLAEHRKNEACASCHRLIDPVGFSLENFDAIGRWRELEAGKEIDSAGSLPGQPDFTGVDGLEQAILMEPEAFVHTLTEKLMTFALGRGVEPLDGPAIREIVRKAKQDDYRFRTIVQGIVESPAFLHRSFE